MALALVKVPLAVLQQHHVSWRVDRPMCNPRATIHAETRTAQPLREQPTKDNEVCSSSGVSCRRDI